NFPFAKSRLDAHPRLRPGTVTIAHRSITLHTNLLPDTDKTIMRIVLIGVSHWHTPFYSEPVLAMTDSAIVAVSDPDASRAAPLAGKAKCPVFTDYREMCTRLKPDFAFVLGRHCDMADEARFLIEARI